MTSPADSDASAASHRRILQTTSIVGGASIANVALGIVRLKAAALLLGPVGVGLIGLYLNLVSVAAVVAGLGFNASAVREIAKAEAGEEPGLLDATRRALVWATAALAILASPLFWLLRQPIADHLLGRPQLAGEVGWLAPAVGLTMLSTTALILLNGFQRIGDIAWVQVLSALIGTLAGITVLAAFGERGVIAYVVIAPAAALAVGIAFAIRLPRPGSRSSPIGLVARQAAAMARLGLPFMLSGLALSLALLLVRTTINSGLGAVALGQFAAAWIISSTYVSFVLQAMGTDYYPRLAAGIDDHAASNVLINQQIEMAVILATPILLASQATAPWLLTAAYSSQFAPAADLLRWQILGDVFKIVSWPIAMAVLAAGRGKLFFSIEAGACLFYAMFVWLAVERVGLAAAGIGYLLMYALYCAVLLLAAAQISGFRLSPSAARAAFICAVATASVTAAAFASDAVGLAVGVPIAAASAVWTVLRLRALGALPSRLEPVVGALHRRVSRRPPAAPQP